MPHKRTAEKAPVVPDGFAQQETPPEMGYQADGGQPERAAAADIPPIPPPLDAAYPGDGLPAPAPKKKNKASRKKRRRRLKLALGLTVTALILAGITYGMYRLFLLKPEVNYGSDFINMGMLETSVQGWGNIAPVESSDIAVKNKGKVKESFFVQGDVVEEGALLFTLDSEELDKEVKLIQDKIDKAHKDLAAIQGDEAELLASLRVTAPFKGKLVDAVEHRAGDKVSTGDKVGLLVDDINMKLSLYFSYAYENDIKKGMAADISIPATMAMVPGTVEKINKVRRVSPEGTTLFEVIFAVKNPGALAADMEATALLRVGGEEVFPSEAGKLAYGRSEELTIKAPGTLTAANITNYMDYGAGETLCRIEYKEDNKQVEDLQDQIAAYEEEMTLKKEGYNDLNVTAPMAGTVMYNNLEPGQMAEPGIAVFSIAKLDKMKVEAQIDERDVGKVKPGMPVSITVYMMDGEQELPGVVKSVNMSAKTDQGMGLPYFPAIFEIENFSGSLMSGMGVNYRLIVERKEGILVAPVIAVKNTEQGTCVFVKREAKPDNAIELDAADTPVQRRIVPPGFYAIPVTCGIGNENGIEIVSGASEGDEVFTEITLLDLEMDPNSPMGGKVMYG